jgi:hypothetical protein
LYADVPAKDSVLNCLTADDIIDADVEVCKSAKNLLNRCCSTSSADYENILPLKRPVSNILRFVDVVYLRLKVKAKTILSVTMSLCLVMNLVKKGILLVLLHQT